MATLFSPLSVGPLALPNRIWMAPGRYYAQRASAGLIVAEATMAIEGNSAFWHEPGIHNQAQV